jgi:hypothetical protein
MLHREQQEYDDDDDDDDQYSAFAPRFIPRIPDYELSAVPGQRFVHNVHTSPMPNFSVGIQHPNICLGATLTTKCRPAVRANMPKY